MLPRTDPATSPIPGDSRPSSTWFIGHAPSGTQSHLGVRIVEPIAAAATLHAIYGDWPPSPTLEVVEPSGLHVSLHEINGYDLSSLRHAGVPAGVLSGPPLDGLEILLGQPAENSDWSQIEGRPLNDLEPEYAPPLLRNYIAAQFGGRVAVPTRRGRPLPPRAAAILAGVDPGPIPRDQLLGLSPVERICYALEQMGMRWRGTETDAEQYVARCPVHSGERMNFTFRADETGRALLHCHACGARWDELLEALGLAGSDLYPARDFRPTPGARRRISNIHDPRLAAGAEAVTDEMAEAWSEEADRYAWNLVWHGAYRTMLSSRLGLPESALVSLSGLGLRLSNRRKNDDGDWEELGPAWTWPEHDARGRVVAIMRRFVNPTVVPRKKVIGSRRESGQTCARGLVHNLYKAGLGGPILVVEGESDYLALASTGHAAIGRPGDKGGLTEAVRLLRDDPRDVVVIGERDRKPGGSWPGDPGPYAERLRRHLPGRSIGTRLPPEPFKDVREYVVSRLDPIGEGKRP